jgi:uncharacterized membrane protein
LAGTPRYDFAMREVALLFTGVNLLLIGLAIPLVLRRVKPNGIYGFRVPATFADEWVWYEANAAGGRDLLLVGVIDMAIALLLPLTAHVSPDIYLLATVGVLVIGVLIAAVVGWRRANRLLEERQRGTSRG